ncbi:MAG: LysR substrate-binding domain-containing protein [Nocardioidaceae bacterium]
MTVARASASDIPPLLGLHAYEASARHLSFVAAAAELHLSPSAISQRVRSLEAHLGVDLFERRPRSLRLTEVGQAYLPAVRDVFEELSAATTGLFGTSAASSLTIRVQVSYATTWLAGRLPDFMAAFPHVSLRMISAIWADTLAPSEVDLEIRQGNGSWPGYRATKVHDDYAVTVYGPGYLDEHGPVLERSSLRDRPRVQVLGFDDLWRHFFDESGATTAPPAAITVDTSVAAIEIVSTSSLWTILPERFTRQSVRDGRLIAAPGEPVLMRQAHYLLRPDDAEPLSGPAAAFSHWLGDQDAADPPLVAALSSPRAGSASPPERPSGIPDEHDSAAGTSPRARRQVAGEPDTRRSDRDDRRHHADERKAGGIEDPR